MINKVIAVGPLVNPQKSSYSGQAMMFQLVADDLNTRGIPHKTIDIDNKLSSVKHRKYGKFSIVRVFDYFFILARIFFVFLMNTRQVLYLTTAQSKVGFLRDYFIINMARLFGYRIVCHQFGANYLNFYDNQSASLRKRIKRTLEKAHRIIVEGDYVKQQFSFLENFEEKVVPIPNGLPERNLKIIHEGKRYQTGESFHLIYLSNLLLSKGFFDVLEAVNILVNDFKLNVECTFAGKFFGAEDDPAGTTPSDTRNRFFKYIEEHDLSSRVKYHEGLFGEEKAEAFSKANVFLLPSYYVNEGQPVSVLEALAYGAVPVVTKYRLIPSMVIGDAGYFVPPKSPDKIAAVISYLVNNPDEYYKSSQACIDLYRSSFTSDIYVDKIVDQFDLKGNFSHAKPFRLERVLNSE